MIQRHGETRYILGTWGHVDGEWHLFHVVWGHDGKDQEHYVDGVLILADEYVERHGRVDRWENFPQIDDKVIERIADNSADLSP